MRGSAGLSGCRLAAVMHSEQVDPAKRVRHGVDKGQGSFESEEWSLVNDPRLKLLGSSELALHTALSPVGPMVEYVEEELY